MSTLDGDTRSVEQDNTRPERNTSRPGRLFRRVSPLVLLTQILCVVLVLGLWEYAAGRWISEFVSSKPDVVARRFADILTSSSGWEDIRYTLLEFILGYGIGVFAGGAVGLILANSRFLASTFSPFIAALNGVPKIALAPLFLILLGLGIWSKVAIAALTVFFVMFYSMYSGVRAQPTELVDVLRVMGADRLTIIRRVTIPSVMPSIMAGLRAGVPFGIIGVIVGEFMASDRGIGFFITSATQHFNTGDTFAGVVLLVIIVLVANSLLGFIEKKTMRGRAAKGPETRM